MIPTPIKTTNPQARFFAYVLNLTDLMEDMQK